MPQFLLAGTFFSIDNFPKWLQPVCKILPLTYLNDALRKIAFDGVGFWEVRMDIFVLFVWGVILYIIAGKVFRWE
jgi:ABC-2 type transport system permease protein